MSPRGLFKPAVNPYKSKQDDFVNEFRSRNEIRLILSTTQAEIKTWLKSLNHADKIQLLEALTSDNGIIISSDFKSLPSYIQQTWEDPLGNLSDKTSMSEKSLREQIITTIKDEIELQLMFPSRSMRDFS